ncbi:MAG: hypothetical protein M0Z98_14045 [Actinomycetales bacterium]|nr:hypothetical protein [Actinomycetales bacterium]
MSIDHATDARGRTRISPARVGIVVLTTVLVGWTGVRAISAAVTEPVHPGPTVFAAYVDVTATPSYPFETPAGPPQSNVILAFVVSGPGHPCTPTWGGAYTLEQAGTGLELDRRLAQLRLTGGEARVSFGGQRGAELSATCTDPEALRAAYRSVVDRYDLTSIDLDLEGTSQGDAAAATRRATAVKAVQDAERAAGRDLSVWLTLPVSPTGLTDQGLAVVSSMLSAGVDLAGVNGMTMDFGTSASPTDPLSTTVIAATRALESQVSAAYARAGQALDGAGSWAKVGITPMIGQNDIAAERFTITDADAVNRFARAQGVGQLSMWSLNRDSTCGPPLPTVLSVVQTTCSGVDQGDRSFAAALAANSDGVTFATAAGPGPTDSATGPAASAGPTGLVDDPAHSPFPIWDPLGTYPAGVKVVWHHGVYQARYWTTGFAPDTPVASERDSPWMLVGPVLPGDTPAPLPTLPAGTYPQWNATQAYVAGSRVQLGLVPYQAKWWSQGQRPGVSRAGGAPWVLVEGGG